MISTTQRPSPQEFFVTGDFDLSSFSSKFPIKDRIQKMFADMADCPEFLLKKRFFEWMDFLFTQNSVPIKENLSSYKEVIAVLNVFYLRRIFGEDAAQTLLEVGLSELQSIQLFLEQPDTFFSSNPKELQHLKRTLIYLYRLSKCSAVIQDFIAEMISLCTALKTAKEKKEQNKIEENGKILADVWSNLLQVLVFFEQLPGETAIISSLEDFSSLSQARLKKEPETQRILNDRDPFSDFISGKSLWNSQLCYTRIEKFSIDKDPVKAISRKIEPLPFNHHHLRVQTMMIRQLGFAKREYFNQRVIVQKMGRYGDVFGLSSLSFFSPGVPFIAILKTCPEKGALESFTYDFGLCFGAHYVIVPSQLFFKMQSPAIQGSCSVIPMRFLLRKS